MSAEGQPRGLAKDAFIGRDGSYTWQSVYAEKEYTGILPEIEKDTLFDQAGTTDQETIEPPKIWKPTFRRTDIEVPINKSDYSEYAALAEIEEIPEFRRVFHAMENEIGKYIVGHEDVIRKVLIAIIAEGHVIIEGMPGTGKTQLVNTIADAINLTFRRISFAPDIMPADITGCDVLIEDRDTGKRTKEFQEGPIFTNLLLADEINRGHPRVHSALLEAMQERKVTYSNLVHLLPRPFFVLATMNPLEQDAVYALPEAQQDRFLFKLLVDYTKPADDMEILNRTTGEQIPIVENVCDGETIIRMSRLARKVPIAKCVQAYTIRLTHATRPNGIYLPVPDVTKQLVRVGASPRAEQAMVLAGKIRALAEGRLNVSFEDIQADAPDVLRHRLIFNLEGEHYPPDDIIKAIMEHVSPYERYDPEIFDKEKKEE